MSKQNYSVARVKTRTQESVGKFERHIERKNEHYANMNVNLERAPMNVSFRDCGELTYNEMLQKLVDEGKVSMRGLKKDAKVYDELIFDINSEYFEEHGGYEFAKVFYEEAYYFAEKLYGKDNILSAVMHFDEINLTLSDKYGYPVYHYHMHVMALPVVEKKVLWSKRCKDKSLIGTVKEIINQISHSKKWKSPQKLNEYGEPEFNEKGKPVLVPSYSILQDQFYEHMQEAGFRDFERGVRGSTAQNKSNALFQAEQDKKRLAAIQEKIEQANEELSTILPVKASAELIDNMGKKTLTGKIQMSGEDYTYLTNLAKECLVNRRDIYFLESSLRGYKSKLAEVRAELAELKSKCKPFLEALAIAPKKVMEFIGRIIKPKYKPVPQKKVLSDPYVWNIAVDPSKIEKAPEQPQKKNKGMSGNRLTTNPPFGYMKNPDNKKEWLIDEEAAKVVRRIFALCVEGFGPTQIAKRLKADKVLTPTEYWDSIGRNCSKPPAAKYGWCADTVARILSKQEYCGDTVNFRSTTKSYKNKTKIERPPEEWKIFPNTHPAIIDREVFELVKELRQHRRRPTRSGIVSWFSGLLYCADCGEKLYYSATGNYKREQANFFCSTFRKNSDECSAHYIREKVIMETVLESMRRILINVQAFEKEFARKQMECYSEDKKRELAEKRRELNKAKKRIVEIDNLIQKLYEDNAIGKISDERYATLSLSYEEEQQELKAALPEMQRYLETETDKTESLQKFIDKVKCITQIKELTPELVHEFIDKIVVYAPRYLDGKRVQLMDIYYNGVGILRELTPEETEEAFQKHIAERKEKTA